MAAKTKPGAALWGVAVLGAGLFAVQTAFADSHLLTLRYLINVLATGGAALIIMRRTRRTWRDVNGPAPEPISLALVAVVVLCLWAAAWWLMGVLDKGLSEAVGSHPIPHLLGQLSDALAGISLQAAAYKLQIAFAVVLVPLVQSWLLWGLLQPELNARLGGRRAVWIGGGLAGVLMALTAVQNVAVGIPAGLVPSAGQILLVLDVSPEMPWGAVSLGGYLLVGLVAALAVALTRSPWAGFVAQGTFAYANFALRDDLSRHFRSKSLLNIEWLTLIIAGVLGAVIFVQVIRFRNLHPQAAQEEPVPPQKNVSPFAAADWLPLVLILAALGAMIVLDVRAR